MKTNNNLPKKTLSKIAAGLCLFAFLFSFGIQFANATNAPVVDTCTGTPYSQCSQITSQAACTNGCTWNSGTSSCTGTLSPPFYCDDYSDSSTMKGACLNHGCCWDGSVGNCGSPTSSCTGTPTKSCSQISTTTCPAVAGCSVQTTSGSCSAIGTCAGTIGIGTSPKSMPYSYQHAASFATAPGGGGGGGTPDQCVGLGQTACQSKSCTGGGSCSWNSGSSSCTGTRTATCGDYNADAATCSAIGCTWNSGSGGSSTTCCGTGSCAGLTSTECGQATGCTWNGASCAGSTFSCSSFSGTFAYCDDVAGCSWGNVCSNDNPPTAPALTLLPLPSYPNTTINVSAYSTDADGNAVYFYYEWYKNGALNKTDGVAQGNSGTQQAISTFSCITYSCAAGDNITVGVSAWSTGTLGYPQVSFSMANVTLSASPTPNRAPANPALSDISPSNPDKSSNLSVIAQSTDPDGNTISYSILWKDGFGNVLQSNSSPYVSSGTEYASNFPCPASSGCLPNSTVCAYATATDGSLASGTTSKCAQIAALNGGGIQVTPFKDLIPVAIMIMVLVYATAYMAAKFFNL